MLFLTFLLALLAVAQALYSANSNVVQLNEKNFNSEVLKFPGVVMVEFYAPW